MDNRTRARIARYAQVEARKNAERDDPSLLTFRQRMFRTILDHMVEVDTWNYKVTHNDTPLWFDAGVLVALKRGKKRLCMVDAKGEGDAYDRTRTRRKKDYCAKRGIPYLIVPHHKIQEDLMIFKLKVKAL